MRHLLLLAISQAALITGRNATTPPERKARPSLQVFAAPYLRGTGNEPR